MKQTKKEREYDNEDDNDEREKKEKEIPRIRTKARTKGRDIRTTVTRGSRRETRRELPTYPLKGTEHSCGETKAATVRYLKRNKNLHKQNSNNSE